MGIVLLMNGKTKPPQGKINNKDNAQEIGAAGAVGRHRATSHVSQEPSNIHPPRPGVTNLLRLPPETGSGSDPCPTMSQGVGTLASNVTGNLNRDRGGGRTSEGSVHNPAAGQTRGVRSRVVLPGMEIGNPISDPRLATSETSSRVEVNAARIKAEIADHNPRATFVSSLVESRPVGNSKVPPRLATSAGSRHRGIDRVSRMVRSGDATDRINPRSKGLAARSDARVATRKLPIEWMHPGSLTNGLRDRGPDRPGATIEAFGSLRVTRLQKCMPVRSGPIACA